MNGYRAISHISKAFAENEKYNLEMEQYCRELEAENDHLTELLEKTKTMKTDEMIVDMERDILNKVESMPAEEIKKIVCDMLFELFDDYNEKEKIYANTCHHPQ